MQDSVNHSFSQRLSPEDRIALDYFLVHSQSDQSLTQFPLPDLKTWNGDYRVESWLYTVLLLRRTNAEALILPVCEAAHHLIEVQLRPLWLEDFFFIVRTLVQHGGDQLNSTLLAQFLDLLKTQPLGVCDAVINLAFSYTTSLRTQFLNGQSLSFNVLDRCLRFHVENLYDVPPRIVMDHYESLITFLSECERTDSLFEFKSLRTLCLMCPR